MTRHPLGLSGSRVKQAGVLHVGQFGRQVGQGVQQVVQPKFACAQQIAGIGQGDNGERLPRLRCPRTPGLGEVLALLAIQTLADLALPLRRVFNALFVGFPYGGGSGLQQKWMAAGQRTDCHACPWV